MKQIGIIYLFISFASSLGHIPEGIASKLHEDDLQINPTKGQPWPLPQQYAAESTFFTIQPENFHFLHSSKCDIILKAIERYQKLTFIDSCSKMENSHSNLKYSPINSNGQLYNLTIKIAGSCEKYPYMNMDEQYLLKINSPDAVNQALLFSTTVWGALRGLETFSQLVYQLQPGLFAVNTTMVLDFPRFSFRGLLLDTSRHFIPVPILLKNLDAMAQTKLNVFHWHIVDDPSFPYVSKKFPSLSQKGAFNPETHIYSQADVATVIEYARLRGIRVLAEFDTPGHTLSWGKGQPDLLTTCYSGQSPNGRYGPLNPINDDTYTFLESFFNEIDNVFPDSYVHLGGDEVSFDCWATNPFIQTFMKNRGFGDNYALLEQYYMQKLLDIVKSLNKSYIVWQEVFDNGVKVKPDTVIHVWKDNYKSELANVTAAGFNTILSSCWYLNYINYGNDWTNYYACDPYDFIGNQRQKSLIIGGEACMWGEYVDGSNVISRTWPRAAAVAERLWSNQSVKSAVNAIPRLEELRCNMIKRGLKVEPVNGPGYCACDYLM
ncbi:beta-hexosaminidase subunit alpha-like isoform X2 [Stegodyphus dumicola]|nr:beta-hexosaminidase subunit alpha-like isoform X2 [Stegodyphus dumicola]XP_035223340.1 beta-hexosaminidase subunit alpha-like isoform X2 [Stegodyphus dumicola]XP_035223341.1 beta-hexosaminidase subunit alpha-like isoform X2 [Stegodyphus dumicola]